MSTPHRHEPSDNLSGQAYVLSAEPGATCATCGATIIPADMAGDTEDTMPETHWHISHTDSDTVDTADDIFGALDTARWHLDHDVDYAYQGISAYGESGRFEDAYRAWQRTEQLSTVLANVTSIVNQHYGHKDRAPLFTGPDGDALLLKSALRLVDIIDRETCLALWECDMPDGSECDDREEDSCRNPMFPNGRCDVCGNGLSDEGSCQDVTCQEGPDDPDVDEED